MDNLDYSTLLKGCYFPYVPKDNPRAKYPCGKCPNCLKRRVDMWSFRLQYHMRFVDHAYFVTLTYAPDMIDRTENNFLTLNKEHFRKYMKRIRKRMKQSKDTPFNKQIKYIVTGEYGSKRGRPHYHAIIFNVPVGILLDEWPYGIVDIREVHGNRIAYVFKYCQKARVRKNLHDRDDRVPEYVDFSQGLGKQWLDNPINVDFHRRNIDNPTVIFNGHRIAIPRYYKERIFSDEERRYIADRMEEAFTKIRLTDTEAHKVHEYKLEKIRLMHKKAKKEQNE